MSAFHRPSRIIALQKLVKWAHTGISLHFDRMAATRAAVRCGVDR